VNNELDNRPRLALIRLHRDTSHGCQEANALRDPRVEFAALQSADGQGKQGNDIARTLKDHVGTVGR
jgi:hypothetical protein